MALIPMKVILGLVEKANKQIAERSEGRPVKSDIRVYVKKGSWSLHVADYVYRRFYHLHHYDTLVVTVMVVTDGYKGWALSPHCTDLGISASDQQGINSLLQILGANESVSRTGKTAKYGGLREWV